MVFKDASEIIKTIESNGHEAFFVGGCVRDWLLQHPVKDIDIATSATPNQIIGLFPAVIPVGIEHGTVIVRHHGISYEVTTYRHEGTYSDHRRPDQVIFIRDIKEDLARRDFTMNALAMDTLGHIIDPFQGQKDINDRVIKTVRNPKDRFEEDALRIMRALRFSSQLGFAIASETLHEMERRSHMLETIAVERLLVECTKFFQGEFIQSGLNYLTASNIAAYLPVFKQSRTLIDQLPERLTAFVSFPEVIALFHYIHPSIPVKTWTNAWKCSNKQRNEALALTAALRHHKEKGLDNWLVYRLHEQHWSAFIHLLELLFPDDRTSFTDLQRVHRQLPMQMRQDMQINGHEISMLYPHHQKGPWIGRLLSEMEKAIVQGDVKNEKMHLKEWIQCHPPE